MIELNQLSKKFGQRLAVDELTVAIPAGEIYGLLGHNGAGKSTTIGMMLGQVWPTSGEVKVCGYDVTAERQKALQTVVEKSKNDETKKKAKELLKKI